MFVQPLSSDNNENLKFDKKKNLHQIKDKINTLAQKLKKKKKKHHELALKETVFM